MQNNHLPGIVSIQMVRCSELQPNLMNSSLCGVTVALSLPSVKIRFYGIPTLSWSGSMVNGIRTERSTLEFSTSMRIPEGERFAFIVTAASGKQYLIGTREPKYPVITYSETTGSPDGEASLRKYKITHVALKSVLPCVI